MPPTHAQKSDQPLLAQRLHHRPGMRTSSVLGGGDGGVRRCVRPLHVGRRCSKEVRPRGPTLDHLGRADNKRVSGLFDYSHGPIARLPPPSSEALAAFKSPTSSKEGPVVPPRLQNALLVRRFEPMRSPYQGFWPERANRHVSFFNPHDARPEQSPRFPRPGRRGSQLSRITHTILISLMRGNAFSRAGRRSPPSRQLGECFAAQGRVCAGEMSPDR
jgi:hypothetical protein